MSAVDETKSKILVIGGTGRFGKNVVDASICACHPTFVLARPPLEDDNEKKDLLQSFTGIGVQLIFGSIHDHEILLDAVKKVDVVISTLGHPAVYKLNEYKTTRRSANIQGTWNKVWLPHLTMDLSSGSWTDKINLSEIIKAIMEAGNVKRFIPSEFGTDAESVDPVEPAKTMFMIKTRIRQIIRRNSIPHTFICNNFFQSFFLPRLGQAEVSSPVRDEISIIGNGDIHAIYNNERDVGTYVIKAVDDPRTLNKILYVRPRENFYSLNQLMALWEKKTGKALERKYITEEELLAKIPGSPIPLNMQLAIAYSAYIKGEQTKFNNDPSNAVEAIELYPEVDYITVAEFMDSLP